MTHVEVVRRSAAHRYFLGFVVLGLAVLLIGFIPRTVFAEKVFGVGVHLHRANREQVIKQLDLARELGVTAIRMDVPWRMVENETGELVVPPEWDVLVNDAMQRGIHCLFILDYGHPKYGNGAKPVESVNIDAFARYAEFVVRHFGGRVNNYEIWNEWDMNVGGSPAGNAKDYVTLVRTVYPRLKAVAPNATILAGGSSGESYGNVFAERLAGLSFGKVSFFSEILSLGLLGCIDGLSVHIYVHWKDGKVRTSEGALAVLDGIRAIMKLYQPNSEVPIHVTEVGWPTTTKRNREFATKDEQSKFLTSFTELALSRTGVNSVYIYELKDGSSQLGDLEGNFGLVDVKWAKKPAFEALSKTSSQLVRLK
jgi:hypothetical protein